MKFRSKALAKLNEGDELDAPAELARPQAWVALLVVGLLVVGGGIWAMTAELPHRVSGVGILTHPQGSFTLQSPVSGQITGVFVSPGTSFPAGVPLFTVRVGNRPRVVKAITGGRAIAVLGKLGQVVSTGADLAEIERIDAADDPLVAVLYVQAADAAQVRKGSAVDLSVGSAPAEQYGVLRGVVTSISQFGENAQQITDFVGDPRLGEQFAQHGQPHKVVVKLERAATPSGYKWSTQDGSPFRVDSRTLVEGAVYLAPLRPIDWVSP